MLETLSWSHHFTNRGGLLHLLWNIISNTKTDMYNIDLHDIIEILLKMALNIKMLTRQKLKNNKSILS
jgi:hypothetical protein